MFLFGLPVLKIDRSTRPKTLLRIAPTLFTQAIAVCIERKMDREILNNGISYFMGPLLNWTLAGVIRTLLAEVQRIGFVLLGPTQNVH